MCLLSESVRAIMLPLPCNITCFFAGFSDSGKVWRLGPPWCLCLLLREHMRNVLAARDVVKPAVRLVYILVRGERLVARLALQWWIAISCRHWRD
jgi:hypothetical protein